MLWQEAGRSIGEYNVSRTMAKSERVKFIAAATTTRISKVTRYAVNIVAIYLGNYMHLLHGNTKAKAMLSLFHIFIFNILILI